MRSLLWALLALVVLPFPVAWLLVRSVTVAAVLAPLVAGLTCAAGAMAAVITRTAVGPWILIITALTVALSLWRGPVLTGLRAHPLHVLLAGVVLAPALRLMRVYPYSWDLRSIWLFHAEWWRAGGAAAAQAIGNHQFVFSHPDYPPLASAAVAMVWRLGGTGPDPRVAQVAAAVLSVGAALTLVLAVQWTVAARRPGLGWIGAVVGSAVVLAGVAFVPISITSGYVDFAWSAWFVAAALLLLFHPPQRAAVVLAALLLTAAVLTKNDSLPATLVLVALAAARFRHRLRDVRVLAVPVVAGLGWQILVRVLGARSDLLDGGHGEELVTGDSRVWVRLSPTVGSLQAMVGWLAVGAVVVALMGAGVVAARRRRRQVGSDLWGWALVSAALVVLTVTYLTSPDAIAYHLASSVDRTTLAPRLLLASITAVWLLLALDGRWPGLRAWRSRSSGRRPPAPDGSSGRDTVSPAPPDGRA